MLVANDVVVVSCLLVVLVLVTRLSGTRKVVLLASRVVSAALSLKQEPSALVALARPVGVLKMEDESGMDEKILAVPHQKVSALYDHVQSYTDLPELLIRQIEHFFTRYKDLEKGKWVKVTGWDDIDTAKRLIEEGVARAGK